MLPENYFEKIKELDKLKKGYINIANYIDKSLVKLNKESNELMKQQDLLLRKMNSSNSSNDKAWYYDELGKSNNKAMMIKGAAQILSELSEVLKRNGIIEGNDKEKKIIR